MVYQYYFSVGRLNPNNAEFGLKSNWNFVAKYYIFIIYIIEIFRYFLSEPLKNTFLNKTYLEKVMPPTVMNLRRV